MWFGNKDKDTDAKERKRGSAKPDSRRAIGRSGTPPLLPKSTWIPLVGLAAIGLGALLTWKIGEALFWENPAYIIKTLTIRVDGPTISAKHVREYMGVSEGTNLFAPNLQKLRSEFLKKTPIAKSASLSRKLPDTLCIDVVERTPIARLGRWGSLAVDREGYVFSLRAGSRDYPVITGSADANLKPGVKSDQAILNALDLMDVCNRSRIGEQVKITSLDVAPKNHIELYLAAGERIKINWENMGVAGIDPRPKIEIKLAELAGALRASEERGRKLVNLDLTFSNHYVPAQEY